MTNFDPQPARDQLPLAGEPYDRWILPGGTVKAEFRRAGDGFMLRFPGEADFAIAAGGTQVTGWPAPDVAHDHFISLFNNAILPLIGDHAGGLFLHGSAVAIDGRAVAFLGESGDGKTTLAGAFAKAGHPFLTEDVIELVADGADYLLQPKPSGLRLYADSAEWLIGAPTGADSSDDKIDVTGAMALPFAAAPAPLAALVLLGSDHEAALSLAPVPQAVAVQHLLPHSFVLDVEDKPRLRAHFSRIVGLATKVPCYTLDYTRRYDELPRVIAAIIAQIAKVGG
ncbi:MAG: hypothetical protein KAF27_10830 [Porphyrobacter sp.]|nr:hypothetical protein [Porphyrobacter sp.]